MNKQRPGFDEAVARYLSGDMTATERAAFEAEVLESDDLAQAVYGAVNLDQVLEPPRPRSVRTARGPAPRPAWQSRAVRWALPLAAGVALVMFLPQLRQNDPTPIRPPVFRGETPVLTLEPFGPVDAPPTAYRWSTTPGAVEYRFELYDLDESRIYSAVTGDTTVALDDAAILALIAEGGMWKVVPIDSAGADLPASDPGWFTVLGP